MKACENGKMGKWENGGAAKQPRQASPPPNTADLAKNFELKTTEHNSPSILQSCNPKIKIILRSPKLHRSLFQSWLVNSLLEVTLKCKFVDAVPIYYMFEMGARAEYSGSPGMALLSP